MYKLGLKLWSTNSFYADAAANLWERGIFQYIELFTVPFTFIENFQTWKKLKDQYHIPFVIHAPHFTQGLNLALKEKKETNQKLLRDSLKFADELDSGIVIIHPGVNGSEDETIRQINEYDDKRLVVENKPFYGLNDELCNGHSPELIDKILKGTGLRFCLDLGHAICAANARKSHPFDLIKSFLALKPAIYHLTDGDFHGTHDRHLNYGKGSYPLEELISLIPDNSMVTNEAAKQFPDRLDDFVDDCNYLTGKIKDVETDVKKISIKKAGEGDLDDVYALSSDSLVRQNSFNTGAIDYSNHIKWFNSRINNSNCIFLIARYDDKFLGQVRFDVEDAEAVVSISVAGAFRDKGIGGHIIKKAISILMESRGNVKKIIALVKDSSEASKKFFTKAGFVSGGETDVNQTRAQIFYFYI